MRAVAFSPDGRYLGAAHADGCTRLVELDSGFWVLDYKSSGRGTERLEDYKTQVRGYCVAVAGAFPARKVRGALIFADGTLVEVAEGYAG